MLFSLVKIWEPMVRRNSPAQQIAFHRKLAEIFKNSFLYVQQRMNIDPLSPRFKPEFTERSGGFFPENDRNERTIVPFYSWDTTRRDFLILQLRSVVERKVSGAIAELGVYQGETAKLFHHYAPDRQFHLFDTFEGFKKSEVVSDQKRGQKVPEKLFSDTNLDLVKTNICPRNNNLFFHVGFFPESIPKELHEVDFG